ncbi:MAG: GTP-binding protein [Pseudomonadota bacterium]
MQIPVTIITGFLGSGKTTVLNALLRDPAFADSAVLINEFGDVQVDHDLVAEFSDEMIMTTTGCLCCTASSDITQSLFELLQKHESGEIAPFKRVIVETTGLLDPVPVLRALLAEPGPTAVDQTVAMNFALSRMVALYDMINGSDSLDEHPEAVRQIALSDVVALTKSDLLDDVADANVTSVARSRIGAINPSADIVDRQSEWPTLRNLILSPTTYDLRTRGEDAIAWLAVDRVAPSDEHGHHHDAGHDHDHDHHSHDHHHNDHHHHDHDHHGHDHGDHAHDTNRHNDEIRSHVIIVEEPISRMVLELFIGTLKLNAGTRLLRMKGLIALRDDPERPVVVHGVQHLIHPIDQLERWPSDDRRTRIVLIGKHLNVDAFREVLLAKSKARQSPRIAS